MMTLEQLICIEMDGEKEYRRQFMAGEDTSETLSALVLLRQMIRRRYREQTVDVQTGRVAA